MIGQGAMDTSLNIGHSDQVLGQKNYHEGDQTLEQVPQRQCKISVLGGLPFSTGHCPKQPDLIRPALSWGLD